MGDILFHSKSSVTKFGGIPSDYEPIHSFLDSSKTAAIGDWRHRCLLHNTFGVGIAERVFGVFYRRPSDGVDVCTRTIATEHIVEDLGCLPTAADFLRELPLRSWMMRGPNAQERMRMKRFSIASDSSLTPNAAALSAGSKVPHE